MKITFNQTPSQLKTAAGALTDNVKRGTSTAKVLAAIETEILSQLAGRQEPEPRGFITALTMPRQMPADIELDLTAGQWRIFKDALLAKAFAVDHMSAPIFAETVKTISVVLEIDA